MSTTQRVRAATVTALKLLILFSIGLGAESTAFATSQFRVMTRNLYDGTDRTGLLEATTFAEFLGAADFSYNNVLATKPTERLAAIAREISAANVDVVGLHEASIWRTVTSPPADGPPPPAEDVQFDFLQILLNELKKLGRSYVAVIVLPGLDVQFPRKIESDGRIDYVRLTDRDAIIVRKNLTVGDNQVLNPQEQDYLSQKVYPVALLNTQVVERSGWASVDLKRGNSTLRLVTTHLAFDIHFDPTTAVAQAKELLATAGQSDLPTVLLGDFNTDANNPSDPTYPTYQTFLDGGFHDAWNLAGENEAGLTCCQDENLANASSKLSVRYDLIFVKGASVLKAQVVGDKATDKTSSDVWPSDHAGVIATLR